MIFYILKNELIIIGSSMRKFSFWIRSGSDLEVIAKVSLWMDECVVFVAGQFRPTPALPKIGRGRQQGANGGGYF